jgi:hypothetical protein
VSRRLAALPPARIPYSPSSRSASSSASTGDLAQQGALGPAQHPRVADPGDRPAGAEASGERTGILVVVDGGPRALGKGAGHRCRGADRVAGFGMAHPVADAAAGLVRQLPTRLVVAEQRDRRRNETVPSLGSTSQRCSAWVEPEDPVSSPRYAQSGKAPVSRRRISASASVSTSAWLPWPRGPPVRWNSSRIRAPASSAAAMATRSGWAREAGNLRPAPAPGTPRPHPARTPASPARPPRA